MYQLCRICGFITLSNTAVDRMCMQTFFAESMGKWEHIVGMLSLIGFDQWVKRKRESLSAGGGVCFGMFYSLAVHQWVLRESLLLFVVVFCLYLEERLRVSFWVYILAL